MLDSIKTFAKSFFNAKKILRKLYIWLFMETTHTIISCRWGCHVAMGREYFRCFEVPRPNGKHVVRNKNGMVQSQTRRKLKALIKMESFEMFFYLDWLFAQSCWKSNYLQFNIKLSRYLHYIWKRGW